MINEFRDVPAILFNPKNEDGSDGRTAVITGLLWLLDFGIDPVTHSGLLLQGVGVLAGLTVVLLALTYVTLRRTRFVK
jgi:hypothetical protein